MNKFAFTVLLSLLPLAASAECGFAASDDGVAIIVGKGQNRCFNSPEFREAFRNNLIASIDAMQAESVRQERARKAYDDRNARGAKLWTIAERQHLSSGGKRYWGQK